MSAVKFGNSDGNWSDDTKWVGGAKPTAADEAIFDATSANCVLDAGAPCRALDCNGYTGNLSGTALLTIGDGTAGAGNIAVRLSAGMTIGYVQFLLCSTSTTQQTLDFAGKDVGNIEINCASGGSYILSNAGPAQTGSRQLKVTKGAFDANSISFATGNFSSNNGNTRSLTWGTMTLTLNQTAAGEIFNNSNATGLTWSGANLTVIVGTASSSERIMYHSRSFKEFNYTVAGSTGRLYLGSSLTVGKFSFHDANNQRTLKILSGATITITDAHGWDVYGTSGKLMVIAGGTAGTHCHISKSSGICSSDYLSLQDVYAVGGATFYAGANSTNVSGNDGWTWTAPVAVCALTGTVTSALAADIVTGGKTIILTLTGDLWKDAGTDFDGARQGIIDGMDSGGSEAHGWDVEVKGKEVVTSVVRTGDQVVTITLSSQSK